jgi:hypothetical protein
MDTIGKRIIVNGDMSGNLVSEVFSLDNMLHFSVHAIWTGSPEGDLIIEASGELGEALNWAELSTEPVSGAGQKIWLDRNSPYKWVRVKYNSQSGSGDLTVHAISKGDK